MKTRLSVKNPPKAKPQAPGSARRGQCRNERTNDESREGEKKTKRKYFQLMLQRESPEQRARRLQRHKDDKRKRRETETEEEKLERKRLEAVYMKNRRRNESPEQRMRRLLQRKQYYRERKEKNGKNNAGTQSTTTSKSTGVLFTKK